MIDKSIVIYYNLFVTFRGRSADELGGLGEEKPGEIQREDDEFDLYRKRMMLAYRFRPNPLVRSISFLLVHICSPCKYDQGVTPSSLRFHFYVKDPLSSG